MISNTHGGGQRPACVAVGRGRHFTRPERLPHPLCRAFAPSLAGTAERRVATLPQRAAHLFAPALYQTRRSPAGPKHQHRQEQAVAGRERIHGPRMLMNGETVFHVPNPTNKRA